MPTSVVEMSMTYVGLCGPFDSDHLASKDISNWIDFYIEHNMKYKPLRMGSNNGGLISRNPEYLLIYHMLPMSLQICPHCNKENPYWRIYKEINFKRFNKGMAIECVFCKSQMKVQLETKSKSKMFYQGIIWMLLPIISIYLAFIGKVSYLSAIIFVIVFHFLAMYYVIKRMQYVRYCKINCVNEILR